MYPYGIIGNCQAAALIKDCGSIDWLCLPRPDSEPIFGKLLDEDGGSFSIESVVPSKTRQSYIANTNVVQTHVEDERGNQFVVTDFFPRFLQYGRTYRPLMLFRNVTPITGVPQIIVRCNPVLGWSKEHPVVMRGNSHIRFTGYSDQLRLTTNLSLTRLIDEQPVSLTDPLYFCLSWGVPLEDDLTDVAFSFLGKTIDYWRAWVKSCSIPPLFQSEVIRSALALKLHCFEETGAVLAAITTSLPEILGGIRNWDYRYCWLRDAYFTVSALYKLGQFSELEGIIQFLFEILSNTNKKLTALRPVYRIDGNAPVPERSIESWRGFGGSAPVRSGNQAADHVQNDVYGEMLLTLSPIYLDERFQYLRNIRKDGMLATLARRCFETIAEPDSGIWEFRGKQQIHAHSLLLSWAGLERYHRIVKQGLLKEDLEQCRDRAGQAATALSVMASGGIIPQSANSLDVDAALLLLSKLRFPDDHVVRATTEAIFEKLRAPQEDGNQSPPAYFYRYKNTDDFGDPQHAFLACSFWMVEALVNQGRIHDAKEILRQCVTSANYLGLLSEHFDPNGKVQIGNFPQCYSHVGLIDAAFAVSPPWREVL